MTQVSMTMGLVSKGDAPRKFVVGFRKAPMSADERFETVRADSLTSLRRILLWDFGHIGHRYLTVTEDGRLVGRLEVSRPGGGPIWLSKGKENAVNGNGTLSARRPVYKDFTKYNEIGMPIYKIWRNNISGSYYALARKYNGEWAYGRDYSIKDGVWNGGSYSMDVDYLYDRVGGPDGFLVYDNKRGPTGRF